MMRKFLPLSGVLGVALMLMFIITGNQSYAQVTSSAINGRITDTKGENLPGATVIAIHEPSGTRYGTTTNSEGLYNLPTVRVGGPYKVTVSFVGYAEQSATNIFANLGAAATVNVQLSDGGTQLTEVTIQGTRDGFTGQRTGAATAFNARQILTLPTVSRDIGDITRLTPQSNGGNSFGGRDGRYNNYQVDGANFNNGFGLNGNPLPGGGGVSIDAIDEVQVNIAPYDVRQSGFSGAGINAVTRSGTNTFSGSAYTFWRNQNQVGSKSGDVTIEKPVSSARTIGFRLGGPLVKNKLFFFVNAEHIENKGAASGAVNLWKASETGASNPDQNITRVRRSDLEAVRSHLINQWGYDPGAYENYANDNSEKTTSLLARLDWNISDKHKLAIRYNQVESSTPSLVNGNSGPYPRSTTANRVSQLSMAFANTMYTQKNIVRSVSAELNSTINNRLSNQFLATYSRIQSVRTSPSSEFPMIDIGDGTGSATNYVNYITAGYELFTYGNDVLNDNINITNNLTYVTGKHNITGGVSFEYQSFGNQYLRSGTSYYRYNSVADFLTTGTANEKAPIQFALTYPYEGQDTYAPAKYGLPSAYVQDKIQVNNKFTVTAGIRAELPMFLNKLTANTVVDQLELLGTDGQPRTYSTGSWPKARVMLSPRIGFRYDVKEDGGFVVRGGTGIFTGRVPFVWLTNMPSNSGVIQNTIEPGSYAASAGWINNIRFQPDKYYWLNNPPAGGENVFIRNPNAGVPSSLALVDRNFKMPQVWRSSLGADYVIPGTPFVITADLMYTKDLQGVYQFGANRKAATQKMNYSGDTRDFYPNAASYTYNPLLGGNAGSVLTNTTKGHSFNATVGVTLRQTKGFYGSLFYSHTSAKTISDNPGSNASSAWGSSPNINNPNDLTLYTSSNALPSRIVGNLSYRFEYLKHLATTITIYYNGANRGRYSFQYNGDLNGDGISADLLYVPNNASELNFANLTVGTGANAVTFTAEQQRAAFDQYVNNVEVLRNSKGGYVDRNAGLLPWVNNFDFRLLQDIFTNIGKQRHSLQFSLDIMNVGNLLNKNWGIQQELITGSNNVLRRTAVTAAGVPTFTMNTVSVNGQTILPTTPFRNVTTTATTWSMQFGLRYLF